MVAQKLSNVAEGFDLIGAKWNSKANGIAWHLKLRLTLKLHGCLQLIMNILTIFWIIYL